MTRCQDCGNQAKRDCGYMRCRSCCRNRGFQCLTHVKSTWVPVSTRRPRLHHQLLPSTSNFHNHQDFQNPKRYRHIHAASSSANRHLGFEGGKFPAEASFPATFRGVRVSSGGNAVDQYAYQTTVNIGGHIFKGIIYDQGPTQETSTATAVGGIIFQQPNLCTTISYPFNVGTQFFPPLNLN